MARANPRGWPNYSNPNNPSNLESKENNNNNIIITMDEDQPEQSDIHDLEFFDSFADNQENQENRKENENNLEKRWNCGYVDAVFAAVDFVLEYNRNLFLEDELQLALHLKEALSLNSKRILCRLLFRKQKWLKSDSFKFYIESNSSKYHQELSTQSFVMKRVNLAVEELIGEKVLKQLSSDINFEQCWEIANQLLSAEQWQLLYLSIFSANAVSSSSSISSKKEFIEFMKKSILSQKTFFGQSLKQRFPELFLKFLQNPINSNNLKKNYTTQHGSTSKTLIVQLQTNILHFFKRILRIYQMTSNFPSMTTGSTFISIYRMIDNYSPLLTIFQMVKYPNYQINIQMKRKGDSFLFSDRLHFNQWESTTELRVLFEELEIYEQEKRNLTFDQIMEFKNRILTSIQPFDGYGSSSESSSMTKLSPFTIISLTELIENIFSFCFLSQLTDAESEFNHILTSLQLFLAVCVLLCFLKLETTLDKNLKEFEEDYMIRYRPETAFTSIAVMTAEILERKRNYLFANLIYEYLLLFPFIAHRRGRWYKRLCINYDHLKLTSGLLSSLVRGLSDKNIMFSDEIDLRDRAVNCRKKIQKNSLHRIKSSKAATTPKKSKSPAPSSSSSNKRKSQKSNGRKTPSSTTDYNEEEEEEDDEENENISTHELKILGELVDQNNPTNNDNNNSGKKESDLIKGKEEANIRRLKEFQFLNIYNEMNYQMFLDRTEGDKKVLEDEKKMIIALLFSNIIELLAPFAVTNEIVTQLQENEKTATIEKTSSSNAPGSTSIQSTDFNLTPLTFHEWDCSICTFHNKRKVTKIMIFVCEMCETPCPEIRHSSDQPSAVKETRFNSKKKLFPVTPSSSSTGKKTPSSEVIDLLDSSDEEPVKPDKPPNSSGPSSTDKVRNVDLIELSEDDEPELKEMLGKPSPPTNIQSVSVGCSSEDFFAAIRFREWEIHSFIRDYLRPYQLPTPPNLIGPMNSAENHESAAKPFSSISSIPAILPSLAHELSDLLSNHEMKEREENNLLKDCLSIFLPIAQERRKKGKSEKRSLASAEEKVVLQSFYVHGRRFGDPTTRKGKSVFCGNDDSFLNVEQFVMQKCLQVDSDEIEKNQVFLSSLSNGTLSNSTKKQSPTTGKNSSGKKRKYGSTTGKKKGSSKAEEDMEDPQDDDFDREEKEEYDEIALEMKNFQIIPYSSIVQECGGWDGWHCEGSILRILFGIFMFPVMYSDQPNVFLTPYQDSPLDFPYPSFYRRREEMIMERVKYLYSATPSQLLQEISMVYSSYYSCLCACISWDSFSLLALQLIALCVGGEMIAVLCYCMSKNYKQLSSGAPDLFMIRVRRRKEKIEIEMRENEDEDEDWCQSDDLADGDDDGDKSRKEWFDDPEQFEVVPMEYFFGVGWKDANANRRSMNSNKRGGSLAGLGNDDLLTVEYSAPNTRNFHNRNNNNNNSSNSNQSRNNIPRSHSYPQQYSNEKKNPFFKKSQTSSSSQPIDLLVDDEDEAVPMEIATTMQETENIISEGNQEQQDSILPPRELFDLLSESDLLNNYHFEAMCVEVKGPTDHLAYKQLFWLQLLSLSSIHHMKAFVGHVREEKLDS